MSKPSHFKLERFEFLPPFRYLNRKGGYTFPEAELAIFLYFRDLGIINMERRRVQPKDEALKAVMREVFELEDCSVNRLGKILRLYTRAI